MGSGVGSVDSDVLTAAPGCSASVGPLPLGEVAGQRGVHAGVVRAANFRDPGDHHLLTAGAFFGANPVLQSA